MALTQLVMSLWWVDPLPSVTAGVQVPTTRNPSGQRTCPPAGNAGGRGGPIPWNPRHIPEEMNASVACGGVKSPSCHSVCLHFDPLVYWRPSTSLPVHFPEALISVSQCTSTSSVPRGHPTPFLKSLNHASSSLLCLSTSNKSSRVIKSVKPTIITSLRDM